MLPDKLASRKTLNGVPFHDMKSIAEDQRIKEIVKHLQANHGRKVALMVDYGQEYAGKGDRYIEKVRQLVPEVKLVGRTLGPQPDVETICLLLP